MIFGNTILFRGCMYRNFLSEKAQKFVSILRKYVDFLVVPENCCGLPLVNLGFKDDFEEIKNRNMELLRKHNVKRIICLCPACYYTFKHLYDLKKIKVVFVYNLLLELIEKGKLRVERKDLDVTIHDPCYLSRYEKEYEVIREILRKIGVKVVEMEKSKEKTFCCGAGSALKVLFPDISNKIAKERVRQATSTGCKYLITACPMCYYHLKENSKGISVLELIDLL